MTRTGVILFFLLAPFVGAAQQQSLIFQVYFGKNQYAVSTKNRQLLSVISDTLLGKTNYILYINGHADSDADSGYNYQLSLKRSLAVKELLLEKGIKDSLIKVQALGEEQPLVANTTPMEKAKNRRVELVVLFRQVPEIKVLEVKDENNIPDRSGDTTVVLEGGYTVVLSKQDWDVNKECLRVEKRFSYKIDVKENWLKRHIGLKNYKKFITYEPHYDFYVHSCRDSCFKKTVKLYIPHYQAPGLKTGVKFSQKTSTNGSINLVFKKAKLKDSAYYTADVYCPGTLNCSFYNGCTHPIMLRAKDNISILSYSYYVQGSSFQFDSLVVVKPQKPERFTDNYDHMFFHTLTFLYKGHTLMLNDIPIDVFAHGTRKVKRKEVYFETKYFLFIPVQKYYRCGHYKKYKLRAKDLKNLQQFRLQDLDMEN